MQFKDRIKQGLEGKFTGLSNGLDRINKYIFNVQRGCYTLIGGLSGSAKTKLVDFILLNAVQDAEVKGTPINIFYYSYEIDENTKKAEWLAMLIYNKYNKIVAPETIKGLGDFRLTSEEQIMVDAEMDNLERLFSKITWRWESIHPTGMYMEWISHMKTRGEFVYRDYVDTDGSTKQKIDKFALNNPEEYNIVICDHIALSKREKGYTLKENLDKLSEHAVRCRNLYNMSFFLLQQFNQGLNSVDRQKFKGVDVSPQQSDFKDTTNPYTDADVVLGLLNAHKMDMEVCLDYNINVHNAPYNLKDRFRMLKVVKNRLSRDGVAVGLLFIPEALTFKELPKPGELEEKHFKYINQLVNKR